MANENTTPADITRQTAALLLTNWRLADDDDRRVAVRALAGDMSLRLRVRGQLAPDDVAAIGEWGGALVRAVFAGAWAAFQGVADAHEVVQPGEVERIMSGVLLRLADGRGL